MSPPVMWQVRNEKTNWGPGCSEHIARYWEKQGYKIRALVVQEEPKTLKEHNGSV